MCADTDVSQSTVCLSVKWNLTRPARRRNPKNYLRSLKFNFVIENFRSQPIRRNRKRGKTSISFLVSLRTFRIINAISFANRKKGKFNFPISAIHSQHPNSHPECSEGGGGFSSRLAVRSWRFTTILMISRRSGAAR